MPRFTAPTRDIQFLLCDVFVVRTPSGFRDAFVCGYPAGRRASPAPSGHGKRGAAHVQGS